MTFAESVKTCIAKYATFSGRATRSEYWYFVLFNLLLSIVAMVIDGVIGIQVLSTVVSLGLLVPGLAVAVRRLHDMGKKGIMLLLACVPFVGLIVIYWMVQPSVEDNEFGPKQA